jgi:hypothetical protein
MVRQVITLGSPFRLEAGDHTALDPLWNRVAPGFAPELTKLRTTLRDNLDVPSTAVYSKSDGIVDWHTCVETPGHQRESIEVFGSHAGLGFNPAVLLAVGDRLRNGDNDWSPFRPPRGSHRLYGRLTSQQPV